ncbi:mobilization protein, partial [Gluconobacter wancherniae]
RDTRRKVILGGLLIDAAGKDERFGRVIDELMKRITRDHDHRAFEGWQKPGPDQS